MSPETAALIDKKFRHFEEIFDALLGLHQKTLDALLEAASEIKKLGARVETLENRKHLRIVGNGHVTDEPAS
jgi:hypothetical protein